MTLVVGVTGYITTKLYEVVAKSILLCEILSFLKCDGGCDGKYLSCYHTTQKINIERKYFSNFFFRFALLLGKVREYFMLLLHLIEDGS